MRKIKLSQGKYALVDDADHAFLSQWKWYARKSSHARTYYAVRNIQKGCVRRSIGMHNILMSGRVDHRNGSGLDNRRANLRRATASEQARNRAAPKRRVRLPRGVYRTSDAYGNSCIIARITVEKEQIYLGVFRTVAAARRAYLKAQRYHHGDFACPKR